MAASNPTSVVASEHLRLLVDLTKMADQKAQAVQLWLFGLTGLMQFFLRPSADSAQAPPVLVVTFVTCVIIGVVVTGVAMYPRGDGGTIFSRDATGTFASVRDHYEVTEDSQLSRERLYKQIVSTSTIARRKFVFCRVGVTVATLASLTWVVLVVYRWIYP